MSDLVLIRRRRYCKNRINSQLRQSNRCCSLLTHLTVLALQHDRYRSHFLLSNWTLWHYKHSILIHEMIAFLNAAGTISSHSISHTFFLSYALTPPYLYYHSFLRTSFPTLHSYLQPCGCMDFACTGDTPPGEEHNRFVITMCTVTYRTVPYS